MVRPQDRGPAVVCCLVGPRGDVGGERFQQQAGHEDEFPVAQDGGKPLELGVGAVGLAHAGRAVGLLGVGGDKAGDLLRCSVVEKDGVEVGD